MLRVLPVISAVFPARGFGAVYVTVIRPACGRAPGTAIANLASGDAREASQLISTHRRGRRPRHRCGSLRLSAAGKARHRSQCSPLAYDALQAWGR